MKFRLHVTSLPHTRVTPEFNACAYTSKVRNFCKMMMSLGHEVFLYAPEGSTAPCTELIQTVSTREQDEMFGKYDWKKEMFKIEWNGSLPYWHLTNLRTAAEITKRSQKGDIVCIVGGNCQKTISDLLDHNKVAVCEPFIGYSGVFSKFLVFESYTHQSKVYGNLSSDPNGNNYHDVIPVYFDPDEFEFGEGKGDEKGDYYLYVGRLIRRKGILVAEQVCKKLGVRLKIAGQGVKSWNPDTKTLITEEDEVFQGDHIEYVGFADVKKRCELMKNAIAAFTPTQYIEPGGNTSVEPQACGTPVLATNFGCFTQQVKNGVSGYRPTTIEEWCWAAKEVKNLDRKKVYDYAHSNYSMEKVKYLFHEYFTRLYLLYTDKGWYADNPERKDWKYYE